MLEALFDETSLGRLERLGRRVRLRPDHQAYTRELERWLLTHAVDPLEVVWAMGRCRTGALVWCELAFEWSDVARERAAHRAGDSDVRCWFQASLDADEGTVRVHGTFNPGRVTCSTANSELRGVRRQFILGQVAASTTDDVELRPLAIATRFLDQEGQPLQLWGSAPTWQRIDPAEVEQFADVDFTAPDLNALKVMARIPEARVKRALATILGEPVVPKDWGGEQSDLWTTRLRVDGRALSAAFVLKGPAGGKYARPMTIAMLGKNGDQVHRLAQSPAEVLVVQHCHEIGPAVIDLLRGLASDFRLPRRYMVLDGFDTFAVLSEKGLVPVGDESA